MAIPIFHLLKTKWKEAGSAPTIPAGYTNDASLLNLTKVDSVIQVPNNREDIIEQLKEILIYAKTNNLKVAVAGAQHSMGGHSISPNGIIINMLPYKQLQLDTANNILTIGAGTLWEDALKYLDGFNKSIAIMQAFSSFSIGGSLSVNGHGWQKNLPPLSASVMSFTLLTAEGTIRNCSRTENHELFKLVIGGYGLFGIILDLKLKVVNNTALAYKYLKMNTEKYLDNYDQYISDNENVALVFGRLRISNKKFLEKATLSFFEQTILEPPPLSNPNSVELKRIVFRGSVNSEYGKRLRWDLETGANKVSKNMIFSRNELLNDHVDIIENKDAQSTDILHEYFIPKRNFYRFIDDMKSLLIKSTIDLLNITIRRVEADQDAYMNYAKETVYGFVILFNQKKTELQEKAMQQLTNQLVDATIKNEGTFYLPYRLHISKEKLRTVYPQSDSFFALKRKYDPMEIFSNQFYEHYK